MDEADKLPAGCAADCRDPVIVAASLGSGVRCVVAFGVSAAVATQSSARATVSISMAKRFIAFFQLLFFKSVPGNYRLHPSRYGGLIRVGCIRVRELQVRPVPVEFLSAHTNADGAKQHGFGQRTGEVEVGPRRPVAFASCDPFVMVSDGPWQRLWRSLVLPHPRSRDESRAQPAFALHHHRAFVANENNPGIFARQLATILQFRRSGRHQPTIVPVQRDRWQ